MSFRIAPAPARLPLLLLLTTLALSVVLNGYLLVSEAPRPPDPAAPLAPAQLHHELRRTRAALEACRQATRPAPQTLRPAGQSAAQALSPTVVSSPVE